MPNTYYRATCESTFSWDDQCIMECTNLGQLYRYIMSNIRYDHTQGKPCIGSRTRWEVYAPSGKRLFSITYTCHAYLFYVRIVRSCGQEGQRLAYYIIKEELK